MAGTTNLRTAFQGVRASLEPLLSPSSPPATPLGPTNLCERKELFSLCNPLVLSLTAVASRVRDRAGHARLSRAREDNQRSAEANSLAMELLAAHRTARRAGATLSTAPTQPPGAHFVSAVLFKRALWAVGLAIEDGAVRAPGSSSFATVAIANGVAVSVSMSPGAQGAGDSELHVRLLVGLGRYDEAASALLAAWARWDLGQRRGVSAGVLGEAVRAAEAVFMAQVPGAVMGPEGATAPLAAPALPASHTVTLGMERWYSPGEGLPAGADASLVLLLKPPLPMSRSQAAALVELGGGPAPAPCETRVASPHTTSLVYAVAARERAAAGLPAPPASLRPVAVELRDPATGALVSVTVGTPSAATVPSVAAPIAAAEEIIWVHRLPLFSASKAAKVVLELSRHAAHLSLVTTGTRTDADAARATALAKLSAQAKAALRSSGGRAKKAAEASAASEPQATVILQDPPNLITIQVPSPSQPQKKATAATLQVHPGGAVTLQEEGGQPRPLERHDLAAVLLDMVLKAQTSAAAAVPAAVTSSAPSNNKKRQPEEEPQPTPQQPAKRQRK
jgi:hypothetical protein